jgi:hypothetical protein
LLWTVEWVHEDQTTSIGQSFDTRALAAEYTPFFNKLHGISTKKRKRGAVKEATSSIKNEQDLLTYVAPTADSSSQDTSVPVEKGGDTTMIVTPAVASASAESENVPTKREDECGEDIKVESNPGTADRNGNYYYLLKPHTRGSQKVLIPLSPTDCLLASLRYQTVLEFPTIQVLSQAPDTLPKEFILEDEYLAVFKAEQDELQKLVAEAGDIATGPNESQARAGGQPIPNAHDILANLERDMGGI